MRLIILAPIFLLFSCTEKEVITETVYITDTVYVETEKPLEIYPWDLDCVDSSSTQADMNLCAGKCYEVAVRSTQELYDSINNALESRIIAFKSESTSFFQEQKKILNRIHSNFAELRDLSGEYQELEFESGTMLPVIILSTKTWVTEFEYKLLSSFSTEILKG